MGEYLNTLDVTLMSLLAYSLPDSSEEIKDMVHSDGGFSEEMNAQKLNRFLEWLTSNPQKDKTIIHDTMRNLFIPRLYGRIRNLSDFYDSDEKPELYFQLSEFERKDVSGFRNNFFDLWNYTFGKKVF
ncbi:hypothetical protein COU57_03395 [Candidatus Pacearchaeota archaeon CG10_big_fil_rev_8_21_14_0_10_32_14]|nr:MAG: hypothetical protein COU57_03395 [Candidatus Pacearchaeota archaeon CG10_big_fil_rev_8_21_14_0_10_32_14]